MDELYKVAKSNITSTIFSEYNEMRKNEFFCDFQIKVGNKSFHVHRTLLIAASKYFKAMFSSNMKEVEQEFIVMKDVEAEGVNYCLEFIYTREIDLSIAPVELTLHASHLMQLDDLTDLCFGYLELNISLENCISTLKLAQFHDRDKLMNIADQYITDHLEDVSLTDSFSVFAQADLLRHLNTSTVDHRVIWQAVMKWLSFRNEDSERLLLELMETLQLEKFPFIFLLETVLDEPLVQGSQTSRDLLINYLIADVDVFRGNLSLQNFFNLRELARNNKILNAESFRKLFANFIEENFEELTRKDQLSDLEEEEILHLFQSKRTKYSTEKIKFDAASKWAKTSQSNRKLFPKLFTSIKLNLLSAEFIQQTVRTEPLVKKSHECKDLLLDYYARGETLLTQQIVCLNSDTGEIKALNLSANEWSDVAKVEKSGNMKIVSVKNMLYLLNDKAVSVLQKDGTWLKKFDLLRIPDEIVFFQGQIYFINTDFMFCYDPLRGTRETNLPGCELGNGFCVAASWGCIYAVGGFARNAKKYDPETAKWVDIAPMNKIRCFASANALNRMVFVMGGIENINHVSNSVELYNPVVQSWTEIANMCCFRHMFSSCVVNDKLYAFGGAHGASTVRYNQDSVEVYDEESGKWRIVHNMKKSDKLNSCCSFSL